MEQPALPDMPLSAKEREAVERLVKASADFQEGIMAFRDHPAIQGSFGELLLRTLVARPEWQELKHARSAYVKARDGR